MSLNKIGYAVEGTDNLYIMPSGTDPLIDEEIFRSPRWAKLAAGFDETGALLILVAPADSAGLGELIDHVDGVVLVKDEDLPAAPLALVVARVSSPTPTLKIPLQIITESAATWRQHRWFYPVLGLIAFLVIASLGLAVMLARVGQSVRAPAPVAAKPIPAPTPHRPGRLLKRFRLPRP